MRYLTIIAFALVSWLAPLPSRAADLDDARTLFETGKYAEAEAFAAEQVERGVWNENWPKLLIQCQLTTGKHQEAKLVYEDAIKRYPTSLTLRLMGIEILQLCGLSDEALQAKNQMLLLMQTAPSRYASRDNLVAMGRYFWMRGEDARQVLELFYDRVRDSDPMHLGACLASAELALSKNDFKVAADVLRRAEEIAPNNPDVHYLIARAWESTDGEKANAALNRALEINPKHLSSLIMQADAGIDRELYDAATETLRQVTEVNPHHQEAWALMAVLAHLRGDYDVETKLRDVALSTWADNPRVDHLIGKKLSQKYRFEEGAAYQRRAIELDSSYLPAKLQLAQDLLRLGHDEVGWELVDQVANQDPYNVVVINLLNLNSRISSFRVLESDGIHVRMTSHEAEVYGQQVLDLLREAREKLCAKYAVEPRAPIVVEIFPEQKDFAIRTFGLPGGAGFLGVCFGRVITANSPASQGESPSNWQSVLWHEFCHVVTLEKTKNRMPRWLSEGISVYEERQRNPSWGEAITPLYRQMMLGESLTPVSRLSGAFLSPPSPVHLQFAYYESSLVVEFLIERYGIETLKQILDDLATGISIDDALVGNVGSLDKLDVEFTEYAHRIASSFGEQADWSRESMPEKPSDQELVAFVEENPNHYWGLRSLAETYATAKRYEEAKALLLRLQEMGCITGEAGDPLALLARVYRELGETEKERETLEQWVSLSPDSLPALRRLIEISRQHDQWERVAMFADQILAIHPLLPEGHEALAEAAEHLDRPGDMIRSLRALAQMDPVDPAMVDFRLANAYTQLDQSQQAKHHVLRALEQAPRFRAAHRLLVRLIDEKPQAAEELEPANEPKPAAEQIEPETEAESDTASTPAAEAPATEAATEPTDDQPTDERVQGSAP